jgi:hypothetical protein
MCIDSWQVPFTIVIKTVWPLIRHKVWIEDYDFIGDHVPRITYTSSKADPEGGLKSGIKIIYDKTSRIKKYIFEWKPKII